MVANDALWDAFITAVMKRSFSARESRSNPASWSFC